MGNTRDKERKLGVRRGGAIKRANFVQHKQEHQTFKEKLKELHNKLRKKMMTKLCWIERLKGQQMSYFNQLRKPLLHFQASSRIGLCYER
jgi:hypothetical protein